MTTHRIHQLPPDVVTKIAAGEVIERPASVVKELLENSLDAGATRIDVELEAGGTELIRVVDNGHGIEPDDLPLAFASHATSKLRNADDLFHIQSMGFRGEALASIGGVAQVTLQSRTESSPGAEITNNGHQLSEIKPWGGAVGTRIEARHLFFNVPVRKKFLKAIGTELGHVSETITRLALANPGVHFVLKHNGKMVFEVPASATLKDRIALFFGAEVRDKLLDVDSGPTLPRLTGYIADPAFDKGNAKLQYLFLNNRWFRDRSLSHALQEGYRGLLMTGRYAVAFLFLEVAPDAVDVNVHPTKCEVRFRDSSVMYSLVRASVKTRLLKENLVPQLRLPNAPEPLEAAVPLRGNLFNDLPPRATTPITAPEVPPLSPRRETIQQSVAPWEQVSTNGSSERESGEVARKQESEATPRTDPPRSQAQVVPHSEAQYTPPPFELPLSLPIGSALQIHDAYIVLETSDGLLVIDQHALHERILYEQLRSRISAGGLEIQRLLIPEIIELTAEQAALVLEASESLAKLGLEVSDFGGNTIALSSYPTLLSRRAPHEILQGVIDYLVSKERVPSKEALLNNLLATMACKAAVKAGDRLPPEEIAHLLHLRQFAEDSHHCPHGRPTSLLFSRAQLDKQFGRT